MHDDNRAKHTHTLPLCPHALQKKKQFFRPRNTIIAVAAIDYVIRNHHDDPYSAYFGHPSLKILKKTEPKKEVSSKIHISTYHSTAISDYDFMYYYYYCMDCIIIISTVIIFNMYIILRMYNLHRRVHRCKTLYP